MVINMFGFDVFSLVSLLMLFVIVLQFVFVGENKRLNQVSIVLSFVWTWLCIGQGITFQAVYSIISIVCFVVVVYHLLPMFYDLLAKEPIHRGNGFDVIVLSVVIFGCTIQLYEKIVFLLLLWG